MITYNFYCQTIDSIVLGVPLILPETVEASSVDLPERMDLGSYTSHFKKYPEDYRRLVSKLAAIKRFNKVKDAKLAKGAGKIIQDLRKFRNTNPDLKEASKAKTTKELLVRDIKVVKKEIGEAINQVAKNTGASKDAIAKAFKEKKVFNIMKAFGFSTAKMAKSVNAFTGLIPKGLGKMFERVADTRVMRKYAKGVKKADQFLDKHPKLKKVAGPAVAGALLAGWLSMQFVGSSEFDLDLSDMGAALAGNFELQELFAGKDGLMFLGLLAGGLTGGPSFAWLGSKKANMALATAFTGMKNLKKADKEDLKKLIKKIPLTKPINKENFKEFKNVIKELGKTLKGKEPGEVIASFIIISSRRY